MSILSASTRSTYGQNHQDIFQSVQDLSQKVQDLSQKVQDLSPKTVLVDRNINPKDKDVEFFDVLPPVLGKSYSGHLSALFKPLSHAQPPSENEFTIYCRSPDIDGKDQPFITNVEIHRSSSENINIDFSCLLLTFIIWDKGLDGKESGPVKISAVIQYQISSEMKQITDPPIVIHPP